MVGEHARRRELTSKTRTRPLLRFRGHIDSAPIPTFLHISSHHVPLVNTHLYYLLIRRNSPVYTTGRQHHQFFHDLPLVYGTGS
jgi:hypothetical protein